MTLSLQTNDEAHVGTHTVTLEVTLKDHVGPVISVPF